MPAISRRVRAAALLALWALVLVAATPAHGETLPDGFQDSVAFSGLQEPTAFRFAPDGRVFVAQKPGQIVVFDGPDDPTPSEFADLSKQVYDNGDRGILGLALDPGFPTRPYVYALYTFDHVFGKDENEEEEAPGEFPHWGVPGNGYVGDPCPKPSDADVDACPVGGRLVRLTADGDHAVPSVAAPAEQVLVEDWCQQTSSHSIGDLEFGPEGALFASGGDGASFSTPDYGQLGWPHKNQCGDPPGGEAPEPPSAEGGSLRSQDMLTPATPGDPTGLNGTVIRIDPNTGAGWPGNPFEASADANEQRILGFGFRNPFRFAINAATDEIYVNNVGGGPTEEIDRLSAAPTSAYNSGWPCFEGDGPNLNFEELGLGLCEDLYAVPGSTSQPFFSYRRPAGIAGAGPGCPTNNGSAISGSAFYDGSSFPASYRNAFFFSDSVFGCIFVMFADADGRPDRSTVAPFLTEGGVYPGVDIQVGPAGDLYYLSLFNQDFEQGSGTIHRVSFFPGNLPPVARLSTTQQWGAGTISPTFDATGSSDADGEPLSYEWDLEGDGSYEPASGQGTKGATFAGVQNHTVAVRVRDQEGATSVARITVFPGDTPPRPRIEQPLESSSEPGTAEITWSVGQQIDFEGSAEDAEDDDLPATSLDWSSRLYHCPSGPGGCHAHPLQAFPALAEGSLIAPDHEYPSRIELRLTATDSRGLSATRAIQIYPTPADLTIVSNPAGVNLGAGPLTQPGPFSFTAIEGSTLTLSAPVTAVVAGRTYTWQGWSDGGARVHTVTAGGPVDEYTAVYSTDEPPKEPPIDEPPVDEPPRGGGEPKQPPGGQGPPAPAPVEPPRTRLHAGPAKRTESRRASFRFSGSETATGFSCRLDWATYRRCRSPRSYGGLAPGLHVFRVIAGDAGNRFDLTPAIYRWRVLP
jgi:glucose/arabinose dehydrogenase